MHKMLKKYPNFGHNDKNYCLIHKGNKTYNMVVKGERETPQEGEYLNFKTTSANTLTLTKTKTPYNINIEYSFYKDEWIEWVENNGVRTIEMPAGSTVYIRGNNENFNKSYWDGYYHFNSTRPIECHGNIMSLIDKTLQLLTIPSDYCFSHLFDSFANLLTVSSLPATTLSSWCYAGLFSNCTNITSMPILPSIAVLDGCYEDMFKGCTSLVNVEELPATMGSDTRSYYAGMFNGCTSLVNPPVIKMTKFGYVCCMGMFRDCISLVETPEIVVDWCDTQALQEMFRGCTSLVDVNFTPNANGSCSYSMMFMDCTSLVNGPDLPVLYISYNSYENMFKNCTSLTNIRIYANEEHLTVPARNNMFLGCTAPNAVLHVTPDLIWDSTELNGAVGSNWTIVRDL